MNSEQFVNMIYDIIKAYTENLSCDSLALVKSINDDGSVNAALFPDIDTTINNIPNQSSCELSIGQLCIVYKPSNQLSQAFIMGAPGLNTDLFKRIEYLENKVENLEKKLEKLSQNT